MTIEEIHNSLINGQRKQAFNQIMEYGYETFFSSYDAYCVEISLDHGQAMDYYSSAVKCFVARIEL